MTKIFPMFTLCVVFIFCSSPDILDPVDTDNNIWLIDISPAIDKVLRTDDTIRVKFGYSFSPEEVQTVDTVFTTYMIVKPDDPPLNHPMFFHELGTTHTSNRWSDTVELSYAVTQVLDVNPQLVPLTFSFRMITGVGCNALQKSSEICIGTYHSRYYYQYGSGIDTAR